MSTIDDVLDLAGDIRAADGGHQLGAAELAERLVAMGYTKADPKLFHGKVTRVEVIDAEGRAFTRWYIDQGVTLQLQDADRTLKLYAGHPETTTTTHHLGVSA